LPNRPRYLADSESRVCVSEWFTGYSEAIGLSPELPAARSVPTPRACGVRTGLVELLTPLTSRIQRTELTSW
jgi:hypothetical protein